MQRQTETPDQTVQPSAFAVRTAWRQQDEIVRVANEASVQRATHDVRAEVPVEQVQVDIRQQRRDDAPYAKGNFDYRRGRRRAPTAGCSRSTVPMEPECSGG